MEFESLKFDVEKEWPEQTIYLRARTRGNKLAYKEIYTGTKNKCLYTTKAIDTQGDASQGINEYVFDAKEGALAYYSLNDINLLFATSGTGAFNLDLPDSACPINVIHYELLSTQQAQAADILLNTYDKYGIDYKHLVRLNNGAFSSTKAGNP